MVCFGRVGCYPDCIPWMNRTWDITYLASSWFITVTCHPVTLIYLNDRHNVCVETGRHQLVNTFQGMGGRWVGGYYLLWAGMGRLYRHGQLLPLLPLDHPTPICSSACSLPTFPIPHPTPQFWALWDQTFSPTPDLFPPFPDGTRQGQWKTRLLPTVHATTPTYLPSPMPSFG